MGKEWARSVKERFVMCAAQEGYTRAEVLFFFFFFKAEVPFCYTEREKTLESKIFFFLLEERGCGGPSARVYPKQTSNIFMTAWHT